MFRDRLVPALLAVVFSSCAVKGVPTSKVPLVFVLAGQSNMLGVAENSRLEKSIHSEHMDAFIYFHRQGWPGDAPFQDSLMRLSERCGADENTFGPELGFGLEMSRLFPGRKVYLIKFAVGGTYLCDETCQEGSACSESWFPGDSTRPSRELFPTLLKVVEGGREAIRKQEKSPVLPGIDGVIWMQGESDGAVDALDRSSGRQCGAIYRENFFHFISSFEQATRQSGFKIVLGEIGDLRGAGWNARSEQDKFRVFRMTQQWNTSESLPLARTVATLDLSMIANRDGLRRDTCTPDSCIYIHYDEAGILELGRRFARAWAEK